MTNAIDIEDLTKSFGNFTAVNEVTMKVGKGEYTGLLGPNGAGKSTILKVVTGMIMPTSGSVTVNGISCRDHRKAMETVGCVIETPECYLNFTPVEILDYVGRLRGVGKNEIRTRTREVLEEVRMWEWRNKPVGKFSKGMKQRVTLAQALMPDPDILIMDEPTSGLDPRGMMEVREILTGLKRDSRSLLLSTHMLNEVSEVCDSVAVIRKGRMMMTGNVRDLLRRTEKDATLEITLRNDITPGFMKDVQNFMNVVSAETLNRYTFSVTFSGTDDREGLVELIGMHGLGLLTMNQKGSDLEALYMSLTEEDDKDDIR